MLERGGLFVGGELLDVRHLGIGQLHGLAVACPASDLGPSRLGADESLPSAGLLAGAFVSAVPEVAGLAVGAMLSVGFVTAREEGMGWTGGPGL